MIISIYKYNTFLIKNKKKGIFYKMPFFNNSFYKLSIASITLLDSLAIIEVSESLNNSIYAL